MFEEIYATNIAELPV